MSYGTVLAERVGACAVLRLNRPDRLNAYVPEMGEDLVALFRETARDDQVRAVIVTGAGRGFCAGADRDCLSGSRGVSGLALGEEAFVRDFAAELRAFPKLTVAAFNGPAAGIGVTMTLCLDIRIAAEHALLKLNFAELGILPGFGASHTLPRLMGLGNAKRLLLCDRQMSARQAFETGLVDEICPGDQLLTRALALGEATSACRADIVTEIKELLNEGDGAGYREALALERERAAALAGRPVRP